MTHVIIVPDNTKDVEKFIKNACADRGVPMVYEMLELDQDDNAFLSWMRSIEQGPEITFLIKNPNRKKSVTMAYQQGFHSSGG